MNDKETLEMARSIMSPSVTAVQVALNAFWERHGKPSPVLLEKLASRLRHVANEPLAPFFGASVGEAGEEGEEELDPFPPCGRCGKLVVRVHAEVGADGTTCYHSYCWERVCREEEG